MSREAPRASRAALFMCGSLSLLLVVLLMAAPAHASNQANQSAGPDAGVSIINGKATKISEWPWQVGLVFSRQLAPRASISDRFFCGGSVLAPRLVITAGHCVVDLSKRQIRQIEVVSGRTRLNSNAGQVARVIDRRMPVNRAGKRRYRTIYGAADWDVSLLVLNRPLSAQPIKLAGPDEVDAWKPGSIAWSTGWGITRAFARNVPNGLRAARQVLMPDGLCRRTDGVAFRISTMTCLGGPRGHASSCNGDSGGPLVVETSEGFRLAGLTSYGDGACRGFVPSVDTRVSGDLIRRWVARTALELTGENVVGSGGVAPPARTWCRVPFVFGVKVPEARRRLEARGCSLGKVRRDWYAAGPSGRIVGYSRIPGWLAPIGSSINVWIAP